jgi:major vault protein
MAEGRERDLVLAPNEYALILDETKGHVIAYVGPHKTSLANTDRPVTYDAATRRFVRCNLEEAITPYPYAEEGWYVVLENPAREGEEEHPKSGPTALPKLTLGRKVNIPGPATFPLWPGQNAEVICGHHLRSNQYLVVQVYNEEAARDNWARAVIKPQQPGVPAVEPEVPDLTMGKRLVIGGAEVSFYIPPTGIEVVRDASGQYVRDAVTLERLEYCILLDEDGNKRFIRGPAVVFPKPTETFVDKNGTRKFKAIELNELTGIYVKVIAPYTEDGVEHKVGEELFITGADQMIYFPRPEHALVKYGDRDIHYAVAIPAGEARYVLNRMSGDIKLHRGPATFLPDPRKEVIVRRVLDEKTVALMFPGNQEALEVNRRLLAGGEVASAPRRKNAPTCDAPAVPSCDAAFAGDDFNRQTAYAPPRTITLSDKYEGAVNINVWTGYAVLVVGKSGARKVVTGPSSLVLEYDETLEAMELSTGVPKSEEKLLKTVYLRVLNNKISDVVSAETRDLCQIHVQVSYRVNFSGDAERWFNVENYVKFLTDHMRSLLHNAIKRHGLEHFYGNSIDIVRDVVLGVAGPDGKRPGRLFEENGMHVYDVEVLDVKIGDSYIAELLTKAQHATVQQAIQLAHEQRRLEVTQKTEDLKRQTAEAEAETARRLSTLKLESLERQLQLTLAEIAQEAQASNQRLNNELAQQTGLNQLQQADLARQKARDDQEVALAEAKQQQRLAELAAEVQAVVSKAGAVSPDLVAALQAFGDKALAEKMAQSMAPLAILGGKSVSEVFGQLLKGTVLERVLEPAATNGKPPKAG